MKISPLVSDGNQGPKAPYGYHGSRSGTTGMDRDKQGGTAIYLANQLFSYIFLF